MALIKKVKGFTPQIGKNCFLADNATIVGEVEMGDDCSIWFNAVVRGDVHYIKIGRNVNIQDGAVIHCTYKKAPVNIGDNVSIAHNAIIHGCTIENDVLIGMGAIVVTNRLNRLVARIESRLEKIKANNENIDAEKIEKQLTEIKSKLSVVSTNIQDAQNSLNTILESNEPKQAFKDVRDLVKEIKNEFIDIHRLLVHLIGDIKGLRVGESNGSTNN